MPRWYLQFSSVQSLSRVRLSAASWTAARQASLSITGAGSNLHSLSWWCHSAISSSVVPFCFRPFPASESFLMSQLFASGGQSIGASASASVLPVNIQAWFPLGWTGWISLQSKVLQESSPRLQFRNINYSVLSFIYSPTFTSIHDYWKNHSFD